MKPNSIEFRVIRTKKGKIEYLETRTINGGDSTGFGDCDDFVITPSEIRLFNGSDEPEVLNRDEYDIYFVSSFEPGSIEFNSSEEIPLVRSHNKVIVSYQGNETSLRDLCRDLGLPYHVVYQRVKRGWTIDQALDTPVNDYVKRDSILH